MNVEIAEARLPSTVHTKWNVPARNQAERAVSTVRGDPRGREIIMEMNFDRYGGVDISSLP